MINYEIHAVKKTENSLNLFRSVIYQLTFVLFIFQIIIEMNFNNFICNLLCVLTIVPSTYFLINVKNKSAEMSMISVVIFLIIFSNSFVPMVGTLLEGNSLIVTLVRPMEVFLHRTLFGGVLLLVHKFISQDKSSFIKSIFVKIGTVFQTKNLLSTQALWALGLWGLFCFFLKRMITNNELSKILDGFGFLMWAPFLLIINPYSKSLKKGANQIGLYGFSFLMILVSLITNSRMAIIGPIATVGCAWLITLVMGFTIINASTIKKSFVIGFIVLFISGELADLSAAILIEREHRANRTSDEQIAATLDTYSNKSKIEEYKKRTSIIQKTGNIDEVWQENYIRNPFISRLVQIKFDDNCFDRVISFTPVSVERLQTITKDKLLSLLPTPFLNFLNIDVNKKYINSFSIGDIIDVLSGNGFLGGFKVGSIIAHAYALFSWWYLPITFVVFYMIFMAFVGLVTLTLKEKKGRLFNGLSTLSLILCFKIFNDTVIDGFTAPMGYIIRGIWQTILLYYLSLKLIELFTNIRERRQIQE